MSRYEVAFALALALAGATGCSGVSVGTADGGGGGAAHDESPPSSSHDGTASDGPASQAASDGSGSNGYPTTNLGWKPRQGRSAGNTIPNVRLPGYAAASVSPTMVSMADFFDPSRTTLDAVVVVLASAWDPYSGPTLKEAASLPQRIRVLSVLGDAAPGEAATPFDLDAWHVTYPRPAHMLDPGFGEFGAANPSRSLPFVMVVVSSTMEICTATAGMPMNAALEADVNRCIATPPTR